MEVTIEMLSSDVLEAIREGIRNHELDIGEVITALYEGDDNQGDSEEEWFLDLGLEMYGQLPTNKLIKAEIESGDFDVDNLVELTVAVFRERQQRGHSDTPKEFFQSIWSDVKKQLK